MTDPELALEARQRRKVVFWITSACLAAALAVAMAIRLFPIWICSDAGSVTARTGVDTLEMKTWCGCFNGMARSEVLQQFGEPSSWGYFPDWDLVYNTGQHAGFGIDDYWLVFRLKDNIVIDAAIRED